MTSYCDVAFVQKNGHYFTKKIKWKTQDKSRSLNVDKKVKDNAPISTHRPLRRQQATSLQVTSQRYIRRTVSSSD